LSDQEDGQWDCDTCEAKVVRNCHGEYTGQGSYLSDDHELFETIVEQCPISAIDSEAVSVVNFLAFCEGGGGMSGTTGMPPSIALKQTNFFFNVRSIIMRERSRIEKIRSSKKKRDG